MNLPNKLTILRALLVPVFIACMMFIPDAMVCGFVSAIVFMITAFTDMLDGKIARKYNLITNFGKFMDPLADKFMVFSALLTIAVRVSALKHLMVWVCAIVFLRELGVSSLRMICANTEAGVVAASFFGKAKTVTQVVAIVVVLIEYAIHDGLMIETYWIASIVLLVAMTVMTIGSGIDYLKTYGKYINPNE
ncbi:MAG: CDP-diacylglycerol--glycerol-3-phosphate 3-phosphatidyltransferase [Clostridia bacterium]|nr:CDP-diacylglycerol--glycerol-3-phosphate 3-phosphatidyltransferase [Clostridia bacterium]